MSMFSQARLHTLPNAPTLMAASHQQRIEHRKRMETLNADKIVPRFGPNPDPIDPDFPEINFFAWECHDMLLREDYWQQCNLVWSWIDEQPVYVSAVDWDQEILPDPEKPSSLKAEMKRRFRLTMLGGGQITVTEHFRAWQRTTGKLSFSCDSQDLRVTADAGAGLQRFTGAIDKYYCEMDAAAVLFLPSTPQTIADRVAATFRLLTYSNNVGTGVRGPDPENFAALLDRSSRCCVCQRPLRDHVSTLLGIGPGCAKQLGMPHNLDVATKILKRRRELLGDAA